MSGLQADAMRTVGCVFYLLKHHTEGNILETLLRSLYIGGDVDSLAALTLAVVGGTEGLRFGEPRGIPNFMLRELEGVEYLTRVAADFGRWVEGCESGGTVAALIPEALREAGFLAAP